MASRQAGSGGGKGKGQEPSSAKETQAGTAPAGGAGAAAGTAAGQGGTEAVNPFGSPWLSQMAKLAQMPQFSQMPQFAQMAQMMQHSPFAAMSSAPQAAQMPGFGQFGQMPNFPQMPGFPPMPNFAQMPGFGQLPSFPQMPGMANMPGLGQMPSLPAMPDLKIDPSKLANLQAEFMGRWQAMVASAGDGKPPAIKDKRFADPSWQNNGAYSWNAALYLLNSEFLLRMADAVDGDAKTRDRIRFATQQFIDAASPANFLVSNPEAQRMLVETQGQSLMAGVENMFGDMQRGKLSQNDDSAFEVGRNVATSKGSVIFQNELMQLIQYAPSTPKVGARPILMVPPCINKFYILDLQHDNSMVAFLVSQGLTVLMVSWRNVGADQGKLGWDDYLEKGVIEPIRITRELSGQDKINLLGFCVGGTIVSTALAALAARGEYPVESLTLLTTLLDFAEPGVLGVFIDEQQVKMREQALGKGGLLAGRELATTFSFLRPSDLVWNYVVNNYLKGKRPPAFDLLYWNGDSTNLPGPMFVWYLRHMYLQNELRVPNRLISLGQPIDLGKVQVPTYVLAAREDHIVPWTAAYQTTQLLGGGDIRFVLSASGHIAGTINPASKNKRSYWTAKTNPADHGQWLEGSTEHPGSWWNDWIEWLKPRMGAMKDAPQIAGDGKQYKALEAAPGSYVKQAA